MTDQDSKVQSSTASAGPSPLLLLVVGLLLLLVPLAFVVLFPQHYATTRDILRISGALGGALIGAWLPGQLHLYGAGYKAGGAMAILVLFFLADPTAKTNNQVNNEYPDKAALVIPNNPAVNSAAISSAAASASVPAAEPASTPQTPLAPALACAFVPIKSIGWRSGNKTNYCTFHGYEQGNFNQGDYSNGGICMTGPEPQVCKDKVTNRLGPNYECTTSGNRTTCVRLP